MMCDSHLQFHALDPDESNLVTASHSREINSNSGLRQSEHDIPLRNVSDPQMGA